MLHCTDARSRILLSALALACALPTTAVVFADTESDQGTTSRIDLARLIELTLSSPRARMARQQTLEAKAVHEQARAARYPKLDLTSFIAPSPDIVCVNDDCTQTTPTEFSIALAGVYGGARVTAVQPIYTFGKLNTISRAAKQAALAAARLEDSVAADLILQSAQAYHGLKLARELTWMLEDGRDKIDKALERLEERIDDGDAPLEDKFRVETLRAEVLAQLTEAKQAEAIALAAIRGLTGDSRIDIDDTPQTSVTYDLGQVDTYLTQARAQRPELNAARAGAQAAEANHEFESAQYWPDLVVIGRAEIWRAQGVDNPPSAFANDPFNRTTAAIALALQWKLDPMSQRARVAKARAQSGKAQALVEVADALTAFDVRSAYSEAANARERMNAAKRGSKSANAWVATVLQAEAIGAAEAKDLADALIAQFTLQARYVSSVYDWNIATVRLRRATGEFKAVSSVGRN